MGVLGEVPAAPMVRRSSVLCKALVFRYYLRRLGRLEFREGAVVLEPAPEVGYRSRAS